MTESICAGGCVRILTSFRPEISSELRCCVENRERYLLQSGGERNRPHAAVARSLGRRHWNRPRSHRTATPKPPLSRTPLPEHETGVQRAINQSHTTDCSRSREPPFAPSRLSSPPRRDATLRLWTPSLVPPLGQTAAVRLARGGRDGTCELRRRAAGDTPLYRL